MSSVTEILGVSAIRRIFLARFISVTGDKLFAIALSWWVVARDDLPNRELTLGLLLAVSTLPMAITGPLLGRFIDRFGKRSCMVVADIGRFIPMAMLCMLIHQDTLTLPLLFALCIPIFALEPLFDTAVNASLSPLSRSPAMLAQMVALDSAAPSIGAVLGALAGGLALATATTEAAFWLNAATFLASLLFVLGLPPLREASSEHDRPSAKGFAFLKDYPDAIKLLVCFGLVNFFVAPLFLYLPLLVRDVLNADGSQLALLELAFAAGNLVAFGYCVGRPRHYLRVRWLRCFLVMASAAFFLILRSVTALWPMCATLAAWGCSVAFVTYLAISYFQRTIPDDCKGRFFGLLTSACTIAIPASFACFGFLSSYFSTQELMLGNAVGSFVISLAFLSVGDEAGIKISSRSSGKHHLPEAEVDERCVTAE